MFFVLDQKLPALVVEGLEALSWLIMFDQFIQHMENLCEIFQFLRYNQYFLELYLFPTSTRLPTAERRIQNNILVYAIFFFIILGVNGPIL